jgi:hypothetical protein
MTGFVARYSLAVTLSNPCVSSSGVRPVRARQKGGRHFEIFVGFAPNPGEFCGFSGPVAFLSLTGEGGCIAGSGFARAGPGSRMAG